MITRILKTGTILSMIALAGCSSLTETRYSRPDIAAENSWSGTATTSDNSRASDIAATNQFRSTPPRRGRLVAARGHKLVNTVSIHAPAQGAT